MHPLEIVVLLLALSVLIFLILAARSPVIEDCTCDPDEPCPMCDPDDLHRYPYYPTGHDRPEDVYDELRY